MSPEIKIGLLVGSMALLLTVHAIVVLGLFAKSSTHAGGPGHGGRVEGLIGLVVPPLAPVFAWRRGTKIRAVVWGAFALLYLGTFVVAR